MSQMERPPTHSHLGWCLNGINNDIDYRGPSPPLWGHVVNYFHCVLQPMLCLVGDSAARPHWRSETTVTLVSQFLVSGPMETVHNAGIPAADATFLRFLYVSRKVCPYSLHESYSQVRSEFGLVSNRIPEVLPWSKVVHGSEHQTHM